MAEDDKIKLLLAGLLDSTPQTSQKIAPMRKRYRRSKSAPRLAGYVPGEMIRTQQLPRHRVLPSMRKLAILLLSYLVVGTICFYLVRDQITGMKRNGVLDSVYFCIVTMTTVGYGDLVPKGVAAILLACAFIFLGMAFVCLILSKAAHYLAEKQEKMLVKAMHMGRGVGPSQILKEVENETHRVRHKCFVTMIIIVLLIVAGTIFLATVEKLDIIDAFYCVCSTITTLGYGDKSFTTKAGRIFATFWIWTSTLYLAKFFLYVAEISIQSRQRASANWVLTRNMTNGDLEAANIDDVGVER